jgi:hypothetical protein
LGGPRYTENLRNISWWSRTSGLRNDEVRKECFSSH